MQRVGEIERTKIRGRSVYFNNKFYSFDLDGPDGNNYYINDENKSYKTSINKRDYSRAFNFYTLDSILVIIYGDSVSILNSELEEISFFDASFAGVYKIVKQDNSIVIQTVEREYNYTITNDGSVFLTRNTAIIKGQTALYEDKFYYQNEFILDKNSNTYVFDDSFIYSFTITTERIYLQNPSDVTITLSVYDIKNDKLRYYDIEEYDIKGMVICVKGEIEAQDIGMDYEVFDDKIFVYDDNIVYANKVDKVTIVKM